MQDLVNQLIIHKCSTLDLSNQNLQCVKHLACLGDKRAKISQLYLNNNAINEISFNPMQYLVVLDISNNNLKSINFTLPFISLKHLNLRNNKIEKIDHELKFPKSLVFMDIGYNKLQYQDLQQVISQLQNIKMMLRIDHNNLSQDDEQKLYQYYNNSNILLSLDENDEVGSQFLVSINEVNSETDESQSKERQDSSQINQINVGKCESIMNQIENQVQQHVITRHKNVINNQQKQEYNKGTQQNDTYDQNTVRINKQDQSMDPVITKTYEELLKIYEKQNILVNFPNPTSKTHIFLSNVKRHLFQALYDVKEKDRVIKRLNTQIQEQQRIIKQQEEEIKNGQQLLRQLTQDYEQQAQLISQINIELNNKNQRLNSYKSSFNDAIKQIKQFKMPSFQLTDLNLVSQTIKHLESKLQRLQNYIESQNKQIILYRQQNSSKTQIVQISRYVQTEYQFSYQKQNVENKNIQVFDDIYFKNTAIQTDEFVQKHSVQKPDKNVYDYYINKYQDIKLEQLQQKNQKQPDPIHSQLNTSKVQEISKSYHHKQSVYDPKPKHNQTNNQLHIDLNQQSVLTKSRTLYDELQQKTKKEEIKFNDIDLQVTKCSDLTTDEMMRLSYYDISKELNKLDLGDEKEEQKQENQQQLGSMSAIIEKYQNTGKLFTFDDNDYMKYLRIQ